jgi:hypothetical protein
MVIAALSFIAVAVAFGGHDQPKAKRLKLSLVTAYDECTSPNAVAAGGGEFVGDACEPAVPSDPVCGFGPDAKGTLTFSAKSFTNANPNLFSGSFLSASVNIRGLDAACEGETLTPVIRYRVTGHGCTVGSTCTTVNTSQLPPAVGGCLVQNGQCKARRIGMQSTDVGTAATVEILECSVWRGNPPTVRTFSCGLQLR